MEHVVFFPAHDGTPAFRRVANLEDAVRLVEHLRNVEGVSEVSVHGLAEVPLAFKTWYRVEVPAPTESSEHMASSEQMASETVTTPVLVPDVTVEQPLVAVAADAPGSLGFFAS
ncbi:MAG: hypothetical protein JWM02_177 [Frankiales bacterium]|nr:hypothetical protein [Frankiales bacterium]